jgi:hypothetical protein
MKNFFAPFLATVLLASISLTQTSCSSGGYYYSSTGPGPVYRGPAYVNTWGGTGFYGGAVYRGNSWNNNNAGYYSNSRGGSASWRNGSGNAYGARGGSASWNNGSGSATGWRGGSASWGGGSGSWHGARGGSGSWHR